VKVTADLPAINKDEILYYLPKIVPGTYAIYDFGRFISDFTAFDIQGNKMEFQPIDANQFKKKCNC
jgi:predicted metalloprotease with PDZ domain